MIKLSRQLRVTINYHGWVVTTHLEAAASEPSL